MGKLYCGSGAVIMDAEGIHRDVATIIESDYVIDQDIANGGSASGSVNLDKCCTYGVTAIFFNITDNNDNFIIGVGIKNSNNEWPADMTIRKGIAGAAGSDVRLFVCGYTGPQAGGTTPIAFVSITNNTGATKHFRAKIKYTKIL